MARTPSGRRTVAPTEHERDASRTADPRRGTGGAAAENRRGITAGRRRFERAKPQPAERHE
jgi:hypothetical protein